MDTGKLNILRIKLVNYDTPVVKDIIFYLLVFNVMKHATIRILNAYFVVSTRYFF